MVYWVFGYGSLIFKPPCHLDNPQADFEVSGYVKGVVRRFAQSSIDHRGTPEHPGRVVTVVEAKVWHGLEGITLKDDEILPDDYVWGIAYRIDSEKAEEVKAYMGEKQEKVFERNFPLTLYRLMLITNSARLHLPSCSCIYPISRWEARSYRCEPEDPAFGELLLFFSCKMTDAARHLVGFEPLDTLAKTVLESEGPSGPNKDYLFKLAESVRHLYPHVKDDYLFNLEVRGPC
ncbi:hypothetical protein CNBC0400 [Cryptococcus deneoformans B-3501A]|uniref:hypothetical protein n=1 Tax=Cryptococcus deneoformans (strain B-3501A) TaxID=283643 RepID=UPI000042F763|nr:hypothetical protein CNBC0400 [Cryptococcus neoformans var. neoformans B-3501A]EAL21899.1 hypothetical protein CNBC0400 [Cryptococcus neoformans var. neoformans B-3501A]